MEHLDALLTQLERTELLRRLAELEPAYTFKHTLTQDSAYQSLLVKQRRELHHRVAAAYEYLFAERLDEFAALLARHYAEAGDAAKTLEFATRAGDAASSIYANAEAITNYTLALDAASHLNAPTAKLYRARGHVYETQGDFVRALEDYEHELSEARAARDGTGEWQGLIDLGFVWLGRDYARSGEYFKQADVLAQALSDPKLHAHSLNRLGNWLGNTGHVVEGLAAHRAALEIFEAQQYKQGMAETLDLLGMSNNFYGDPSSGARYYDRAIELFRELKDQRGLVSSLTSRGHQAAPGFYDTVFGKLGDLAEAKTFLDEALRVSQQIGWRGGQAYAEFATAMTLGSFGQFGAGLAHAREALRIATEIDHQQWIAASYSTLGQIHVWMLDGDAAVERLETGLPIARQINSEWWIGNITAVLAFAYLLQGKPRHAERALEAVMPREQVPRNLAERQMLWAWGELEMAEGKPKLALEIAERLLADAPGETRDQPIPVLCQLKGEALFQLEHLDEAESALLAAKRGAQARSDTPRVWPAHAALARLYQRQKRAADAQRELDAARALIDTLAASIDDAHQREIFVRAARARLPIPKSPARKAAASSKKVQAHKPR